MEAAMATTTPASEARPEKENRMVVTKKGESKLANDHVADIGAD